MTMMNYPPHSRYLNKCPVCGVQFHPSEVSTFGTDFPCPNCGVELKYAIQHKAVITVVSLLITVGLAFAFGLSGITFALAVIFGMPFSWLFIMLVVGQIDPPPAIVHKEKEADNSLSLFKNRKP